MHAPAMINSTSLTRRRPRPTPPPQPPGLSHIYVLAQFNSTSLNRHLGRAYGFLNGAPPRSPSPPCPHFANPCAASRCEPLRSTTLDPGTTSQAPAKRMGSPESPLRLRTGKPHLALMRSASLPPPTPGNLFTGSRDGCVECLNATQRPGQVTADAWYKGTAGAARARSRLACQERDSRACACRPVATYVYSLPPCARP